MRTWRSMVLLAAAGVASCGAQTTSTPAPGQGEVAAAFECTVTLPPDPAFVPPQPWNPTPSDPGMAWFGSDELWTIIDTTPTEHLPRKSVWWSVNFHDGRAEQTPAIEIIYQRLDTDLPEVVHAPPGTNAYTAEDHWFMINGIEPTERGCWQATASYKGTTLSYVYEIE